MTAKQIPVRTSSWLPSQPVYSRQENVPSIKISLAQLDVSDSLKPVIFVDKRPVRLDWKKVWTRYIQSGPEIMAFCPLMGTRSLVSRKTLEASMPLFIQLFEEAVINSCGQVPCLSSSLQGRKGTHCWPHAPYFRFRPSNCITRRNGREMF